MLLFRQVNMSSFFQFPFDAFSNFWFWLFTKFVTLLKGDVSGSLAEFDKAIELDSRQKACKFLNSRLPPFFVV